MGCKELIESLRAAGDEKIRALRAAAEQEAGKVRAEAARRIEEVRAEQARKQAAAAGEEEAQLLSEANRSARQIMLLAEKGLSERLFSLALSSLPTLRNVGYREVFAALVRELPRFHWQRVRVNPEDAGLAKEHFPDAAIIPDKGMSGGLDAESDGGQVTVVNTFEKRLERVWEEMLPEIMKEAIEAARNSKRGLI